MILIVQWSISKYGWPNDSTWLGANDDFDNWMCFILFSVKTVKLLQDIYVIWKTEYEP